MLFIPRQRWSWFKSRTTGLEMYNQCHGNTRGSTTLVSACKLTGSYTACPTPVARRACASRRLAVRTGWWACLPGPPHRPKPRTHTVPPLAPNLMQDGQDSRTLCVASRGSPRCPGAGRDSLVLARVTAPRWFRPKARRFRCGLPTWSFFLPLCTQTGLHRGGSYN